jgi:hypothetical protein
MNPVPTNGEAANSYFLRQASFGVDCSTYGGTGTLPGGSGNLLPNYPNRSGGVAFEISSDIQLPLYTAQNNSGIYNVDFSYNNPGNWFNYTRSSWPAGNYEAYARVSGGQGNGAELLNILTSGYGTTTQTTNNIGQFFLANGTDWTHYYWVPLVDGNQNLVPVNIPGGQQTLQLCSSPIAGENVISFILVPFPTGGVPPSIGNVSPPNGSVFVVPSAGFSFTVTAATGTSVNNNGIHLKLNGGDVTSGLQFAGAGPINVSYAGLKSNTVYTAVVSATNTAGSGTSRTFTFDTINSNNFYVKSEDFDYNGGSYDAGNGLVPNAYEGNGGAISNIDYKHDPATAGNQFNYRSPGLATEFTTDVQLPGYAPDNDYDVGWFNNGDWGNFTRTYPAGTYYIYGRLAGFVGHVTMSKVTSGLGTENQTLQTLGTIPTDPINQGWANWNWCLMVNNGLPAVVSLGGVQTLRMTSGGNANANYIMLVPVKVISVTASSVISGGNFSISFPTVAGAGYSVWQATSLNGPWSLAQSVGGDGSVKTVNIPATGSGAFFKVTSP